jgi:hypothetical protein
MGQYHKIVNLDKKEFLHPFAFDDGLKLLEFGSSGNGTMKALAVLLSNSPNRGGGDLRSDDTEWYGRWAADRIVIAGDYAEYPDKGEDEGDVENIYSRCDDEEFRDISQDIIRCFDDAKETIRALRHEGGNQ